MDEKPDREATGLVGATPSAGLRRLVFYSVVTGLAPLIPVPFVDDWARDLLRRRHLGELVASELAGAALALEDRHVAILACGERRKTAGGCCLGCLLTVFKSSLVLTGKALRKVFRKIFFFLTIRDCVTTATQTFHEGFLLRHALTTGALAGSDDVRPVRQALEGALANVDQGPIERLFRHALRRSWRAFRTAARRLGRQLGRLRRSGHDDAEVATEIDLEEAEETFGPLVDELTEEMAGETGHLAQLAGLFDRHLPGANLDADRA